MSQGIDIFKESLSFGFNAGNSTAGATEKPLDKAWPVNKHVVIHADADNTDPILIGTENNSANGFVLAAGETSPPIYVDDVSKVFITGASSNPAYSWISH